NLFLAYDSHSQAWPAFSHQHRPHGNRYAVYGTRLRYPRSENPPLPRRRHHAKGRRRRKWALNERAMEGTWPHTPVARPAQGLKREDWDAVFSEYDVATDVVAISTDQLVEAYPDAKVVLI
ncbi:uncharacterized protein K444DRAFT_722581, partial [Hyaloscypha bicolor E]